MDKRSTYLSLLAGISAISISALMVKQVAISPTASAFWRMFYAAIIIYGVYLWRGNFSFTKGWKHTAWVWPALLGGIFLAIDMVIWHKTIVYIGAGPATFLGNSQIIFVTIFGALVYRERLSWLFPLVVPAVLYGLFLLVPLAHTVVVRSTAYYMGLAVGLTYAGYLICLRYAKQASGDEYPEILSLSFIMLVTALSIAIWGAGVEHTKFFAGRWQDHCVMAGIALISNTLGWLLIKANLTRIPAHQGSLLLLLQPMLTTVWAGLFFAEGITSVQVLGAILVAGGIAAYQLHMEFRSPPRSVPDGFEE
jgi:drug/metabolite transporter (DMT)-like permease